MLNAAGGDAGASTDARREEIEQLVDAVHCHARTLALLAPSLRSGGVEATRESLVQLMAEMDQRYPIGHPEAREKSVFASVELSLRRMSPENRERARVLGVFHGGVQLGILSMMTKWDEANVTSLAVELIETGLATPNRYNHLTLNPALCPYLGARMEGIVREEITIRWVKAMLRYAQFLEQQQRAKIELAATLTQLELPNLFALLDLVERSGAAEMTIGLATSLYSLVQALGKPRLLERVGNVRDTAAAALGQGGSHLRFEAARTRIEQQLAAGYLSEASSGAHELLQSARTAGKLAYDEAEYDLAGACWLLARVLKQVGQAQQALTLLHEARQCNAQFGHASEPWKSWAILADIETDAGNLSDAARAEREAVVCYLAYRRDGGENHDAEGRISLAVIQSLVSGDPAPAASQLQQLEADTDLPSRARTFIRAVQAIVAGSRDRTLADAPDLGYRMASEILFLIETLEKPR